MTKSTKEATTPKVIKLSCSHCGETKEVKPTPNGEPRLPRGWKRLDGVFCSKCWSLKYAIRAVTIPVTGPLDSSDWPAFRESLKTVWRHATRLSNWAQTTLYARDVRRGEDDAKLPPMPTCYLYGEARDGFHGWNDGTLDKASAGDILQSCEQRYRSQRYEVLWTAERSLASYRYPQPYPFRPDNIRLGLDDDGRMQASIRIAGVRWMVRLAGGSQYRRQLAGLRQLLENSELMAQGAVYQVASNKGDHRNGVSGRNNGNGGGYQSRVMLKVVGWFPVSERDAKGTLFVRTDADSLIVALDAKDVRLWFYNGDHAKRICLKHQDHMRRLKRLSDDRKAERRKPNREGLPYQEMVSNVSKKDRDRLTTMCLEVSASLVNFAKRRKMKTVQYDDSERGFSEYFPWAKLKLMVKQKCRASGIEFVEKQSADE